jgi:hypothetical protein
VKKLEAGFAMVIVDQGPEDLGPGDLSQVVGLHLKRERPRRSIDGTIAPGVAVGAVGGRRKRRRRYQAVRSTAAIWPAAARDRHDTDLKPVQGT